MVKKNIGCTRRVHTECCANDATARVLRLDYVRLKVLVEVVPDRGRPELDRIQQPLFTHVDEGFCKVHKVLEVSQFKRCRIGRGLEQEGPNQACLTTGIGLVALVGIGITS